MTALIPYRALLNRLGSQELVSACLYLVLSSSSHVSSSVIGSLSEYRFPYPILTTTFHLLISTTVLSLLHLLLRPSYFRASHSPSLSRLSLFPPLLVALSSLISSTNEFRDPTLRSVASQLLVPLAVLIPKASRRFARSTRASWRGKEDDPAPARTRSEQDYALPVLLFWGLGTLGPSASANAGKGVWSDMVLLMSEHGLGSGSLAVVEIVGWWGAVVRFTSLLQQQDHEAEYNDDSRGSRPSPPSHSFRLPSFLGSSLALLLRHMILCLLVHAFVLVFLTSEISRAYKYGHFSFFLQGGFWAQEVVIALCGLVGLVGFWSLVMNIRSLPLVFYLVNLKTTFFQPLLYHILLGNPFHLSEPLSASPNGAIATILTLNQVKIGYIALVVYYAVDSYCIHFLGARRRNEGGVRKES